MKTQIKLDTFQAAYVTCALWSSNDDNGEPLDSLDAEVAQETLEKMAQDCNTFRAAHSNLLDTSGLSIEQQGHDLWLSRNGHGAGFFDRPMEGADRTACNSLQEKAREFSSFDLYVGDDGQIYGS